MNTDPKHCRWDAGQERCRTGEMKDRGDEGQLGCRICQMQDRSDAGQVDEGQVKYRAG